MQIEEALASMDLAYREVRKICEIQHKDLLSHLDTYHAEAVMARQLIDVDLQRLRPTTLCEIGAGTLELSLQLIREGFQVTAIEPSNIGFSFMARISLLYLSSAKNSKVNLSDLNFVNAKFEEFISEVKFDYLFAINVLEHVQSPKKFLTKITLHMKNASRFRIYNPNYGFPFEPHFNKILVRRRTGRFYLHEIPKIKSNTSGEMLEAQGLYNSLNYVTRSDVFKMATELNMGFSEDPYCIFSILVRALNDGQLRVRHPFLGLFSNLLNKSRLIHLTKLLPNSFSPIMSGYFEFK